MSTWQKIIAATIIGVLWLAAIVVAHHYPDTKEYISAFILALAGALSALGIHSASQRSGPMVPTTYTVGDRSKSTTEGGCISLRMLTALAGLALGLALLGGCSTTTGSMYAGLETQAKAGIRVADDNFIQTVKDAACGLPYSAIQRHSEIQPAIQALCGTLDNSARLDADQLALLMSLLKSSGVQLRAAPAPTQ